MSWRFAKPTKKHSLTAGWYGNDTTWSMVLDLNKIAIYGKADGTLSDKPQRQIYSITDAIIGGQGNGPLNPVPLPLGFLGFSNSSPLNDLCFSSLMGFDFKKLPLIMNSFSDNLLMKSKIFINDVPFEKGGIYKHSIKTTPPDGWIDYL